MGTGNMVKFQHPLGIALGTTECCHVRIQLFDLLTEHASHTLHQFVLLQLQELKEGISLVEDLERFLVGTLFVEDLGVGYAGITQSAKEAGELAGFGTLVLKGKGNMPRQMAQYIIIESMASGQCPCAINSSAFKYLTQHCSRFTIRTYKIPFAWDIKCN